MKFTPPGGRVALQLAAVDSQARVIVTDNGEGISPKTLPHIFDRFHQGNGSVTKGGLGLGLAIARHVVKAHRGAIEARSAGPGKGATFIASFQLNAGPTLSRTD